MLPLVAAVTLAMNALCLAANSGLLRRDERLARPSLTSDRGDSEPGGTGAAFPSVAGCAAAAMRAARRLRLAAEDVGWPPSAGSIVRWRRGGHDTNQRHLAECDSLPLRRRLWQVKLAALILNALFRSCFN